MISSFIVRQDIAFRTSYWADVIDVAAIDYKYYCFRAAKIIRFFDTSKFSGGKVRIVMSIVVIVNMGKRDGRTLWLRVLRRHQWLQLGGSAAIVILSIEKLKPFLGFSNRDTFNITIPNYCIETSVFCNSLSLCGIKGKLSITKATISIRLSYLCPSCCRTRQAYV